MYGDYCYDYFISKHNHFTKLYQCKPVECPGVKHWNSTTYLIYDHVYP